jgi:hypothetical protein
MVRVLTPLVLLLCLAMGRSLAQVPRDSVAVARTYKNVIRYNLSGALLARWGGYFVIGYERIVNARQSFSINVGRTSLPNLTSLDTYTYTVQRDVGNGGYNISVDYRFYLAKENKFAAPRGLYIGPYFSYNHFTRKNEWLYKVDQTSLIRTRMDLAINTVGFELGYQLFVWKRISLDFLMVGPGIGFYKFKASTDSSIDGAEKEELYRAVQALAASKIPGMNYVLGSQAIGSNGSLRVTNVGYRYIFHIGFIF